jgi:GntR family transcriptional repressor for pyruvate dehydrogenase complex
MALKPLAIGFKIRGRETLLETIARRMIGIIMEDHYKAGVRLPSEYELAKQFDVGRGAVREALKALSVVGLVRVERGKGTYVADRSDFLIGPISLGLDLGIQFSSVVDARKLIETELAGLAARHADANAIRAMQGYLESMQEAAATGESEKILAADLGFHFTVANAAGNVLLGQFLTLIRNLMSEWISRALKQPGVADEAVDQHRSIFEAIRKHKPREARKQMVRHLEAMSRRLAAPRRHRGDAREVVARGDASFYK